MQKKNRNPKWLYDVAGTGSIDFLCRIVVVFCFIRRRRERVIASVALPLQTFNGKDSSDEEEIIMLTINNFNLKQNKFLFIMKDD